VLSDRLQLLGRNGELLFKALDLLEEVFGDVRLGPWEFSVSQGAQKGRDVEACELVS
jgi:hypothetical protein